MPTTIDGLAGYLDTRNALMTAWSEAQKARAEAPFSEDKDSAYQKFKRIMDKLQELIRRHSDVGLKVVDEAIATSDVVARLRQAGKEAKEEAESIADATDKLTKATKAVDMLAKVVDQFAAIAV